MMLHAGVDGGMHDVLLGTVLSSLAWTLLWVNAAIYWTRRAIQHFTKKGGK